MKRLNIDGYDLYTPQEEPTNDWYIIPFVILGAIVATIVFLGVDNVIEVVSELIVKW
jgi:hypothetical protein